MVLSLVTTLIDLGVLANSCAKSVVAKAAGLPESEKETEKDVNRYGLSTKQNVVFNLSARIGQFLIPFPKDNLMGC